MIGVEGAGDAAHMLLWIILPPDCLARCECGLKGCGGLKTKAVAGNSSAIIVQDNRQPRTRRFAIVPLQPDIQERVVCLPHRIRVRSLSTINQVELLAIDLCPFMSER